MNLSIPHTVKRFLSILVCVALGGAAFAQGFFQKQIRTINEVEIDDGAVTLSVFDMPDGDVHRYFLCVGRLGTGDDVTQFNIDPVAQLFIPLGGTLAEAQAKLEEIRGVANRSSGEAMETVGILATGFPSNGETEPVYLTARRVLFHKNVEFTVRRDGYIRSTVIGRNDLGSLLTGFKFYRKIHPKQA